MKYPLLLSIPLSLLISANAFAHGDVTPQAMDTSILPDIGEKWLDENPWSDPESETWANAVAVGASGYVQNCARCHGLEVVSGGLAPDLRLLSADMDGDEWYMERFRNGATQNGITKMPGFEKILGQKAAWAIRTYVETRPADGAFKEHNTRLLAIRDTLKVLAGAIESGSNAADYAELAKETQKELSTIGASAKTASKAPKAESAVSRAAIALDGSPKGYAKAAEMLTIGLSATK
jgi:cytochrome c-550 PedF